MRRLELQGAMRDKAKDTTVQCKNAKLAEDLAKREFDAPGRDKLWVADFTYVPPGLDMV
jgi:hypothetical protein